MSASELSQLFSSPIRFDHYMMHALYDPLKGYYASKVSYTEDFITAPTHSEYQARATAGWLIDHEVKRLVEYGPGQGYWAQDIVSNARCKNWVFDKYYMVEPSEALRALQSKALSSPPFISKSSPKGLHCDAIIANEVLDALPCRRFRWHKNELYEWYLVKGKIQWLPCHDGQVLDKIICYSANWDHQYDFEICDYDSLMQSMCGLGARHILLFDYGYHAEQYFHQSDETSRLKVIRQHQHVPFSLEQTGNQDLSTPVNWTDVEDSAARYGYAVKRFGSLMDFLLSYQAFSEVSQPYHVKELMIPGGLGYTTQVMWLQQSR